MGKMVYTNSHERQVDTMDSFEQNMLRRRKRQIRFLLCIPILIALILGAACYVFAYHINRFQVDLELNGEEHIVLEYGTHFVEPGAAARFYGTHLAQEGIEIAVERTGSVDESRVGTYELHYTASHEQWSQEKTRTVEIVDTAAPRIFLSETPGSYVVPGQLYQEEGFMARDNYDGDLTDRVEKYTLSDRIVYAVTDSSGNRTEAVREIVYYDPEPPKITLRGDSSITLNYGQAYDEPGFTATDNCDGDLTEKVKVSGSVQITKAGTYKLYYSVEDSFGNTDTAVRTVRVKEKPKPKPQPAPQQSAVTPSGKVIYLTFDDGPSRHTERLLEVLKKYNVKATFFVVKNGYSHLLDDIVAQGHAIGAHTYCHEYETIYASEEAYFSDLNKILSTIESKTGVSTKLIRFPGGSSNTASRFNPGIMSRLATEVVNRGYRYFDWNVNSGDAGGTKSAEKVAENVISGISGRRVSIVLQHDTKSYSVDAVEDIIVWGLENGYTFLPLQNNSPTAAHTIQN